MASVTVTPLVETFTFLKKNQSDIFESDAFTEYLQVAEGKSGEVAKAITSDIKKFFSYAITKPQASATTHTYIDILLNTENILAFMKHLKLERTLAPTTITEKLRRIMQAVDYTLLINAEHAEIVKKCEHIKLCLQKWIKSMSKDIKKQKMQQALKSEQEIMGIENPLEFWENPKITGKVAGIVKNTEVPGVNDYTLVLSYMAANIIYPNAHRPGVVENMTIEEYTNRMVNDDDGSALIRVLQHKTSCTGPANIVITKQIVEIMHLYFINIRKQIQPQSEELAKRFFLSHTGNVFRKISEFIKKTAAKYGFHIMPNPSLYRKRIATEAFESIGETQMRGLNKHMAHSPHTSRQYYQLPPPEQSLKAHEVISKLNKRSFFTKEQDSQLLQEWPLASSNTPALQLCERIVQKYKMMKTKRQLQDRWKTMKQHFNK